MFSRRSSALFAILLLTMLACGSLPGPLTPTVVFPTTPTGTSTALPATGTPATPVPSGTPLIPLTEAPSEIPPFDNWLEIYFTDPSAPNAGDYTGGPDEALADAIDQARLSVDVAVYSFNLWSIRDALINAWKRGVNVRMVTESDNMDYEEVQELIDAGIPVLGDRREGSMHDKFAVIDRSEVWTGSMNFTVGAAYRDNNNLIRIRSVKVAEDYEVEFEEMFTDDHFGPDSPENTPNPDITVNGTRLEIYFSPDDGVLVHLIELIQGAQESIYFLAYSFTSDELGAAIQERAAAGVAVAGVMDKDQIDSNPGTEYDSFLQAGLDVRLDGNDGLMHNKVIIIDRSIVITGSYNFSASAEESNDENVVVIFNPIVALKFLQEFLRIFEMAGP